MGLAVGIPFNHALDQKPIAILGIGICAAVDNPLGPDLSKALPNRPARIGIAQILL